MMYEPTYADMDDQYTSVEEILSPKFNHGISATIPIMLANLGSFVASCYSADSFKEQYQVKHLCCIN